jgi:hypothetical protein
MQALTQTIRQLQTQRNQMEREVQHLEVAIQALDRLHHNVAASHTKPRRKMSLDARRKIAAFQKARWAKIRAAKSK